MPGMPRRRKRRSRRAVPSVASDFLGADLGDLRLTRRLLQCADSFSARPDQSFPDMLGTDAELEAFYRFEGNERVDPQSVLRAHAAETGQRCGEVGLVVVPHDTSDCGFSNTVEGLGPIAGGKKQGFFLHASLAVAADGYKRPLGVLNAITWVRPKRKSKSKSKDAGEAKESARWIEGVRAARKQLGPSVRAIHVMDREADAYPLLAAMVEEGDHFVVRAAQDRLVFVDDECLHLRAAIAVADAQVEVEALLSKRGEGKTPYNRKTFPARSRRKALLNFSARRVALMRPKNIPAGNLPAMLEVNVIHVWEPAPPDGFEPVEWLLLTSEPIDTTKAITAAVDYYRMRWVIEEFFKALKTGCAFETRQIATYHGLVVTLMIFLPVACRLLFLRSLARTDPGASAGLALTKTEIEVLRVFSKRVRLGNSPTIREALLAVAGLGGHLKRNGEPGWQTLARGMEKLLAYVAGWDAAVAGSR